MSLALPSSLTWRDLAVKTYREVVDDDVPGLAAQLSYYFFLALFPAILFGLALASFFPLGTLIDDLTRLLGPVVSPEVRRSSRTRCAPRQRRERRLPRSASSGLGAVPLRSSRSVGALNRAYDIEVVAAVVEGAPMAMGLTIGLAVVHPRRATLVLAGPSIATYLDERLGMGSA